MAQQDSLQFCPNCGAKLKPGAVFCGNCGFNIAAYKSKKKNNDSKSQAQNQTSAPDSNNSSVQKKQSSSSANRAPLSSPASTQQTSASKLGQDRQSDVVRNAPTRPVKPTKKWPWITAAIVFVVLIGGFLFGQKYYAQENQLNRAMTALKSNDKNVAKNFTVSDAGFKLNRKNIQPLIKELKSKPSGMAQFQSQLKNSGATNDGAYSFVPSGRAWLVFPRYKIKAKTFSVKLRTNRENVNLSVNGKSAYKTTTMRESKSFGPYISGQYELTAEGNVDGHHMTNDGIYSLTPNSQTDFDLELRTISFTATGYPGAQVKINDKSYGKLDSNGSLQLTDVPWTNDMELTMVYNGAGGKVTSNAHKVTDNDQDSEVSVGFPGVMSHADAKSMISNLFEDMSSMSSNGDIPSDFSEFFVNGSGSTQYSDLVKMAKGYYHQDNINSTDYTVQDLHVVPNKVNQTNVTYNVKFKFYGDNGATHTQVFQYVATIDKTGSSDKIQTISSAKQISDTSTPGDNDSDSDSNSDSSDDSDDNNDDSDSNDTDSDSDDDSDTDDESYQTNNQTSTKNLNYVMSSDK